MVKGLSSYPRNLATVLNSLIFLSESGCPGFEDLQDIVGKLSVNI